VAAIEHSDVPAPRSASLRPRKLIVGLAVLAVGLAGLFAAHWLRNLAPLSAGSDFGAGPNALYRGAPGASHYRLLYRNHGTAYWLVSVSNTSRFDVRLDGLNPPSGGSDDLFRLTSLRVMANPQTVSWLPRDTVPFHPITLHHGAQADLVVVLRFVNCRSYAPGSSATISMVPLHYTLFGLWGRTENVPVPAGLQVGAPGAGACPGH
jgi:hypothetical protein